MKKYYMVLFAISLFLLLAGLATGCQGSAVPDPSEAEISRLKDDYVKLDARISEIERQLQVLQNETTKVQKPQENASSQTQGVNAATIESMQIDIEALHRIACLTTGRPQDYYNYLADRYGQFKFDDRRGNLTIDLPGDKQVKLPIFK